MTSTPVGTATFKVVFGHTILSVEVPALKLNTCFLKHFLVIFDLERQIVPTAQSTFIENETFCFSRSVFFDLLQTKACRFLRQVALGENFYFYFYFRITGIQQNIMHYVLMFIAFSGRAIVTETPS